MISNSSFFDHINFLIKEKHPFAAFKMPNSSTIECYADTDKNLTKKITPLGSGFIMMPFNLSKGGYLITPKEIVSTQFLQPYINNRPPLFFDEINAGFKAYKKEYLTGVLNILTEIACTDLIKSVYSTSFEFELNSKNVIKYFKNLLGLYPSAFCSLFFHPNDGFWMGASPETLIEIQNKKVLTMALAGTKKLEDSKWGKKELREQKIVQDEIQKNLAPICKNLTFLKTETSRAGGVEHLKTIITGDTNKSPWEIITALHPTPAVAGVPKNKAISTIAANENHDRSFYSGFLGKINSSDCKLFVNLRCLHIKNNQAKIFVGGGITQDSEPEKEWEELLQKSQTMLNVLF